MDVTNMKMNMRVANVRERRDCRWLQNASSSLIHNLHLVLCTDIILQFPIIVHKCFKVLHFQDKFYAYYNL